MMTRLHKAILVTWVLIAPVTLVLSQANICTENFEVPFRQKGRLALIEPAKNDTSFNLKRLLSKIANARLSGYRTDRLETKKAIDFTIANDSDSLSVFLTYDWQGAETRTPYIQFQTLAVKKTMGQVACHWPLKRVLEVLRNGQQDTLKAIVNQRLVTTPNRELPVFKNNYFYKAEFDWNPALELTINRKMTAIHKRILKGVRKTTLPCYHTSRAERAFTDKAIKKREKFCHWRVIHAPRPVEHPNYTRDTIFCEQYEPQDSDWYLINYGGDWLNPDKPGLHWKPIIQHIAPVITRLKPDLKGINGRVDEVERLNKLPKVGSPIYWIHWDDLAGYLPNKQYQWLKHYLLFKWQANRRQ